MTDTETRVSSAFASAIKDEVKRQVHLALSRVLTADMVDAACARALDVPQVEAPTLVAGAPPRRRVTAAQPKSGGTRYDVTADDVLAVIRACAAAGATSEEIRRIGKLPKTKMSDGALRRRLNELLEAKVIRAKGQKRGRRYFVR